MEGFLIFTAFLSMAVGFAALVAGNLYRLGGAHRKKDRSPDTTVKYAVPPA